MVGYGPQAAIKATSHSSRAQMRGPQMHGAPCWNLLAQRYNVVLSVCCLQSTLSLPGARLGRVLVKAEETGRHDTGLYVQNKAPHTKSRETVVFFTPPKQI